MFFRFPSKTIRFRLCDLRIAPFAGLGFDCVPSSVLLFLLPFSVLFGLVVFLPPEKVFV